MFLKLLRIALMTSFLAVSASASAGSFEDAASAFERGDYKTGHRLLKPMLAQGDYRAQYIMGWAYEKGRGVKKDPVKAMSMYQAAVSQGSVAGLAGMARLYEAGEGVPKDEQKAFDLFKKAADHGNTEAQYETGLRYAVGKVVERNPTKAVEYYRQAAEKGNTEAQYRMGVSYYVGFGVIANYEAALSYYRKAAEAGHWESMRFLGHHYYSDKSGSQLNYVLSYMYYELAIMHGAKKDNLVHGGKMITGARLNDEQIKEARELARAWRVGNPLPTKTRTRVEPKARPVAPPGRVMCHTQCMDGNCLRTYSDGRTVRFQAEPVFDPVNNQWEWGTGPC